MALNGILMINSTFFAGHISNFPFLIKDSIEMKPSEWYPVYNN